MGGADFPLFHYAKLYFAKYRAKLGDAPSAIKRIILADWISELA